MTNQPTNEKLVAENKLPFTLTKGYTRIPNSLFRVYTSHPKFSTRCFLLYSILLQYYNYKLGYAFPTQAQLAVALGVDVRTIQRTSKTLVELRLIHIEYNKRYANNRYTFPRPAETVYELEEMFPDITPHLQKLYEKNQATRKAAEEDAQRLMEWRIENGLVDDVENDK